MLFPIVHYRRFCVVYDTKEQAKGGVVKAASQLRYARSQNDIHMPAQTSMLHVRVDDQIKAQASDALAGAGLTLSDAVRILLTRVATEGGLPAGLTADPDAYDA